MSGFPKLVADACARIRADILFVTVEAAALSKLATNVSQDDVAVFAGGSLVAHIPRRAQAAGEALASLLLMLINEGASARKMRDEEAAFAASVRGTVERAAAWATPKNEVERPATVTRDPHVVLGVKPGVSRKELKKARDRMLSIAHSDRVENLHPALRERATELTREIIAAYDALAKGKAA